MTAVKTSNSPSLIQSSGDRLGLLGDTQNKTITIIRNNYLKSIREDLLEEEFASTVINNNEIILYIRAEVNEIPTEIMIDTRANVSLIDSMELNRIQKECKKNISILPVNNIILIGATGHENK